MFCGFKIKYQSFLNKLYMNYYINTNKYVKWVWGENNDFYSFENN